MHRTHDRWSPRDLAAAAGPGRARALRRPRRARGVVGAPGSARVTSPVLVTGATGTVGGHVVAELRAAGVPLRAAVRSPAAARDRLGDGVELVRFDFTDPATWSGAFRGASRMLLVRPPRLGNVRRDLLPAMRAARAAGVRHVVFLSVQGAERNPLLPHHTVETWLRASGLEWTFLRASYFMQNISTVHARDVRDRDAIVVPAGRGRTAFVDARDVAALAALALRGGHEDRAWTPTGGEALTYAECAAVLATVLGRPVRYADPGPWAYARHARRALGMDRGMVAVTLALYTAARFGLAAGLTDDVPRLLGRAPIAFRRFAEDSRAAWAG